MHAILLAYRDMKENVQLEDIDKGKGKQYFVPWQDRAWGLSQILLLACFFLAPLECSKGALECSSFINHYCLEQNHRPHLNDTGNSSYHVTVMFSWTVDTSSVFCQWKVRKATQRLVTVPSWDASTITLQLLPEQLSTSVQWC